MSRYSSFYPVKNIVGSFVDEFLNRSISDIVGGDFAHNLPAVNLKENEGNYQLEMAAPGLTKEDFKIFLENKQLVIEVKKETKSETEENGKVLRKEFNYSEFKRTFSLPENVDSDKIGATYEKGILLVTVPKATPKENPTTQIHIS